MKSQTDTSIRSYWMVYVLAMVLLAVGVWRHAEEQFARDIGAAEKRAATEQAFIGALVRELLQGGNFEDVQPLVSQWGEDRNDTASVSVTSGNGFELGHYVRSDPAVHPLVLESVLEYGYGNRVRLQLVRDAADAFTERRRTVTRLSVVVAIIGLFGGHLVRTTQKRKNEARRYRSLSERFSLTNKELQEEIEIRKSTERALSDESESAEVTLNSIGDAVITTNANGVVTRINPSAERLTGWSHGDACGLAVEEVFCILGSNGERVDSPVRQVIRRGKVTGLVNDTVLVARGGGRTQIADSAAPIHGPKGAIEGVILVFRDVDEEYRIRKALVESETRFRRLVESLVDHFLMTQDSTGTVSYVSPSVMAILGYSQSEFCQEFNKLLTDHPGNARFRESTRLSQQGHRQPPYTLDIRAKSGDIRVLEVRQVPVFDGMGGVIVVESIAHDVTDRLAAGAEQRLAASVFENSAEGIMVTDLKGKIQRVNRAFTSITGYSEEDAVGRSPRLLHSGQQSPQFYLDMWQSLRDQGRWQGEIWNRHKNGKIFPEWLSISRIPDPDDGREQRYVGVFSDISRQKAAEQEIARLAFHDALTELPNRVLFMDRLATDMARAQRKGHVDALLFLDLDHFKHVNDSLGHSVGDKMLLEVARRLRENVREYDTVARLGGDEFVVLINAVAEDHHLAVRRTRRAAEKIRNALVEPMNIDGHELHSSPSIGIALVPLDANNAEDALKYADKAMYQAKSKGRNTVQFFTLQMQTEAEQRLVLENELRRAIEHEELELHFQPIVDFSTTCIAGLEALIRWHHPRHGMISPAKFIPIAEESGLILPIGEWVLEAACCQIRRWQDAGLPKVFVSVNLSAVQFRQADISARIAEILRCADLDPKYLELELTESLLVENVDAVVAILKELADMGISLSVDDFGTGYSSLSYLRKFRLHKLKIDRSFVDDLPENPDATAITTTIIQMAQNLGLRTVAEGVESNEQLDYLKEQGCDFAQGYLCSRPVPAAQVPELLKRPRCPEA